MKTQSKKLKMLSNMITYSYIILLINIIYITIQFFNNNITNNDISVYIIFTSIDIIILNKIKKIIDIY